MPNPVPPAVDAESTAHLLVALARAFKNDIFATDKDRQEAEFTFDILLAKFARMDDDYRADVWAKIDALQSRGW